MIFPGLCFITPHKPGKITVSKNAPNHVKPHLHATVAHDKEKDVQQKRRFLALNKQTF
jgi:hypothetical protein